MKMPPFFNAGRGVGTLLILGGGGGGGGVICNLMFCLEVLKLQLMSFPLLQ